LALDVATQLDDLRIIINGLDLGAQTRRVLQLISEFEPLVSDPSLSATVSRMETILTTDLEPAAVWRVVQTARMDFSKPAAVWSDQVDFRKPIVTALVADYNEKKRQYLEAAAAADLEARKKPCSATT